VTATEATTAYRLKGKGYGFCNCQPGCTCNFSGFPTSPDGSCKAAVGTHIVEGFCGDVALNDIKAVAIIDWPKAIHDGINSGFSIPGVGQARGTTLKNPVTGEDHFAAIVLEHGFIWKRGDCGQGTFDVEAEGIHLSFENSNWILYEFDWTNED
jgi:hypothetical protein